MRNSILSSRFNSSAAIGALAATLISTPASAQDSFQLLRDQANMSRAKLATAMGQMPPMTQILETDQCGSPAGGLVGCDISDGPFPTGIAYFTDGDLTVGLEDGLNVNPDPANWGINIFSEHGSIVINGAGADVNVQDSYGIGAFAAGDIDLTIDDVTTSGIAAYGIATLAFEGDTVINADEIRTNGDYSLGIVAQSLTGNISVSANSIDTIGLASDGITVTTGGDIDVQLGSFSGEGDYVWGVNASSGGYANGEIFYGSTNVDVGSIDISGDHAIGVVAVSYGSTNVKIGEIAIDGNNSLGVYALSIGDISVEVGNATFTGQYSGGIIAYSEGNASAKAGTITAEHGGGLLAYGIIGSARAEAEKITVRGDYYIGISSLSRYGNATVKVGEVSTNGIFAVAVNADALYGDVVIDTGKITTQGDLAMGIRAMGRTSTINAAGPVTTNGYYAFGILNSTGHGDAVVRTEGAITTSGYLADGMWITARYGTADIKTVGKVSTNGIRAMGIKAHSEDGQVRLVANEVETSGAMSHGIDARSRFVEFFLGQPGIPDPVEFTGDLDVTVESVKVTGTGSIGLSARGLGTATLDVGSASAFDSFAIETNMIEDSSINVRKAATSTHGSAIHAKSRDVAISIAGGATVSGAVDGIIVNAVGERCVMRAPTDGTSNNPCPNPGDQYGYPDPEPVPPGPPGVGTITNAGTIKGGSGYSVRVESGTLSLTNRGTIVGSVLLSDGDDIIDNEGTFVLNKDSDFGAGNDLFLNKGTLKLSAASTAADYRLLNLERLENSGTVDLRNGVAGDRLILAGNYVASGSAAKLGLDVDLGQDRADKLIVQGAATGKTEVVLNMAADQARLTGSSGVTLIEVGAGSAADAFALAGGLQDVGFIQYGLTYDAASRRYLLQGVAGAGAYRQFNALDGVDGAWHATADAWRSNIAASRTDFSSENSMRNRLWGQWLTSRTSRDAEIEHGGVSGTEQFDYGYEVDRSGAQIGFDLIGLESEQSELRFGVAGGHIKSDIDSLGTRDQVRVGSTSVGAYLAYASEKLFGSLVVKYDWNDVEFDAQSSGYDAETDGSTLGFDVEAGARFATDTIYFEPLINLVWTSTHLESLNALGQRVDFSQSTSIRGKLGVRFGGQVGPSSGDALQYYGSVKAVHDFGESYRLTLISGANSEKLAAERVGTFGEGTIGASYRINGGFEGFVEVHGELGSDYDSIGGRTGVRVAL